MVHRLTLGPSFCVVIISAGMSAFFGCDKRVETETSKDKGAKAPTTRPLTAMMVHATRSGNASTDEVNEPSDVPRVKPKYPPIVDEFLIRAEAQARQDVSDIKKEWGDEFQLDFRPLFCTSIKNFGDAKASVYLVGFTLGCYPGNGINPMNKNVVIDMHCNVLMTLDEKYAGEEAVAVGVCSGRPVVAVSSIGGRPYSGKVTIVTLESQPRALLEYQSPQSPYWYSTLYFLGPKDRPGSTIMVKRICRDFVAKTKRTEHLIFDLDEALGKYREQRIRKPRFDQALAKSGAAPEVPHIEQYGPPYEESFEETLREVSIESSK